MGIFNFLKSKDRQPETITLKVERSECDIAKTQTMIDLFQTPPDQRDQTWKQLFYENVQTASYACNSPQVFTGPDGFPYFSLRTPEPNLPFESFCIKNMKDDFLLDKGWGIAINPKENSVDWVFSYGDIVNLHVNNEFVTKLDSADVQNQVVIKTGEQVLIAQPSDAFLPMQTRQVLKVFLQGIGIKNPKIMMVCRNDNGQIIQELVFNIFREDFQSTEDLNNRLRQISWFLPRHYIVLSLPKSSNLTSHFAAL